jgi:hypothetical protein
MDQLETCVQFFLDMEAKAHKIVSLKKKIKTQNQRIIIQKQKHVSKFNNILKDPKLLKKIALNSSSNSKSNF